MSLDQLLQRLEKRVFVDGQARNTEAKSPVDFILPGKLPDGCILRDGRCGWLENLPGVGPGCLFFHGEGPWREEWRRLDSLTACPRR